MVLSYGCNATVPNIFKSLRDQHFPAYLTDLKYRIESRQKYLRKCMLHIIKLSIRNPLSFMPYIFVKFLPGKLFPLFPSISLQTASSQQLYYCPGITITPPPPFPCLPRSVQLFNGWPNFSRKIFLFVELVISFSIHTVRSFSCLHYGSFPVRIKTLATGCDSFALSF